MIADLRLRAEAYPPCSDVVAMDAPMDKITASTAPGGVARAVTGLRITGEPRPCSRFGVMSCARRQTLQVLSRRATHASLTHVARV